MLKVLTKWPVVLGSAVLSGVGAIVLLKDYGTIKYKDEQSLTGKTAIITGANTGIGKEVARQFAKRGARVVMACKDLECCVNARKSIILDTKNPQVICRKLDLASLSSVRDFVKHFNKTETGPNYLINNAGVMHTERTKTDDAFELHLGVNHFGHFLLTMLLLPNLKASAASAPTRVINVTCAAHNSGEIDFDDINFERKKYRNRKAYAQSKLANILFTRRLAQMLDASGVKVFAVNPGLVNTEIYRYSGWYKNFLRHFVRPFLSVITLTPNQGSQPIMYCALSPEVNNEVNGAYFNRNKFEKPSKDACDDVDAHKLWLISEKWTRLT